MGIPWLYNEWLQTACLIKSRIPTSAITFVTSWKHINDVWNITCFILYIAIFASNNCLCRKLSKKSLFLSPDPHLQLLRTSISDFICKDVFHHWGGRLLITDLWNSFLCIYYVLYQRMVSTGYYGTSLSWN